MNKSTLYHNPRCSKSRQALELLQQNNVDVEIVEYLKTPPSAERIQEILTLLNLEPRQLMRKGEDAYRELSLDDESLNNDQLIAAMANHPKLIERPILVMENSESGSKKATIGRPPENVLTII